MSRRLSNALSRGLVSVALMSLLAACGGGGGGSGSSSSSSSSSGGNAPPPDTTPEGFTFTGVTGQALSAPVASNEVVVTGINAAAPISITGGEYSIDGGAFTSAAGTVSNNQRVRVRVTASGQFSTAANVSLTIGGVSATFSATTLAADTTPATFSFAPARNAVRNGWVTSDAITIADINTGAAVSVENGEYSIAGGTFTSAVGMVNAGQSVVVRVRASSGFAGITRATLNVGGVVSQFEVLSEVPHYVPDAVAYDGQDTLFLLNNTTRQVFRWSIANSSYVEALALADGAETPVSMAYLPAHQRLYFGYTTGAIRQITVSAATPTDVPFIHAGSSVTALGNAGNFLAVQLAQYSYDSGRLYDSNGLVADNGGYYYGYSRETAWDATNSRLYYTRDGLSPNDLHYDVVDQSTGQVTASNETPYHGSYNITPPIRVSQDGAYVLLGSGDIYQYPALNWSASLGSSIVDAHWFANNSLVAITTSSNQTVLRRLGVNNLTVLEQRNFTGQGIRVIGTDARMAVLVQENGNLRIHTYVPNDDSDGDGVSNTQDAFPLDVAASVDTDRDGYPDSWNSGRTQADSTTGLTLDAFPQDAACYLPAHGSGGVCNYAATMPDFVPDRVIQNGDIVYLLSSANNRVYRWSIAARAYLNPYVVGIDEGYSTLSPQVMAYSPAHQRLYLGYSNGAIRYIDTSNATATEHEFANVAMGLGGLASVGDFLLAQDSSGAWETHYVINSAGTITDQEEWNHYSPEYAWDPVSSRVYFFSMWSPADLNYEVIDQTTGQITGEGETPYHGSYAITAPIRVSVNGEHILLGSGDIYARNGLNWSGSAGTGLTDARWFADGSLATLITDGTQTTLRRLGANTLTTLEQVSFAGQALRIVGSDSSLVVLTLVNGALQFHTYVPNDDSDGDGVANTADAFPLDRAASTDTDRDGYPDAWNPGRSQADSTTGLVLDSFPQDAACWLPAHGSGGVCNYGATIPNYVPDQVVHNGNVIYLLSTTNRRVYRWSISGGAYMNPLIVGINQGFSTLSPTTIAYSAAHGRLYLGYPNGAVRYIDPASGTSEVEFLNLPTAVQSLSSAGNLLVAQASGGQLVNANGVITAQGGYYYGYSREIAWDAVNSRIYFTRDGISPNDLHYNQVNASGAIIASAETPYHGSYNIQPPIRVSGDGELVLLGSGDLYQQNGLTWAGSIGSAITDARWMANDSLVTLTTSSNQTLVHRLGADTYPLLEQVSFAGAPLRVFGTDTSMTIVANDNGVVRFHTYVPNDDSDGDGVTNTADAFPLDRAASVDSDRDGRPDAWNPGRSQADSTTGLVLDAFPQASGCWLVAHGSGGVCNPGSTVPAFVPGQIVQNGNIVYLLSSDNRRVYRRSISGNAWLNPYIIGVNRGQGVESPTKMAYSGADNRLYLGYANGAIRYIDVAASGAPELPFANVAMGVGGLAAVGDYLLAQDGSGAWATHYVFDNTGAITHTREWNHQSPDYAWDPVTSRVYYFSMWSPADLNYEVIDQTNGQITSAGETPYHGSYGITPPIRVSNDGQYVMLGSGDLYASSGLTWAGSVGATVADARWFADGSVATAMTSNNQTMLRRLAAGTLTVLEQRTFTGTALRIVGTDAAMVVIVNNNGTLQFHNYVPSNDSDNDGVTNTADAFPLDVAASVDTDNDGYPDSWNPGRSQADSTTGLVLDSFPQDAACWLPSHGSGGVCNNAATIPNYIADKVVSDGDVIYLLSSVNRRVYRWSMATGNYLNPYIVGLSQGFTTLAPTHMEFSPSHDRLYLGYASGAVRYIDVNAGNPVETAFTTLSAPVSALAHAGNYLFARGNDTYVIDSSGNVLTQQTGYSSYGNREHAWDPVTSRLYYTDYYSSSYFYYSVIDQTSGQITATGQSTYYGYNYNYIQPPIRVSPNGQQVIVGNGDVYAQNGLTRSASLGKLIKDAQWTGNLLVTLDNADLVEIRNAATRQVLHSYQYTGQPLRVLFGQNEAYLVHVMTDLNTNATTTSFTRLAFYDGDADQIPRWFEQRYSLNDANAADALADPDADGLNNRNEYLNLTNPQVADTDGDGLNDSSEVNTWNTNPTLADTDGDGLNDQAEVINHHTDPRDVDSDNDGYSDLDEVLWGGDPNDSSGLPQPIQAYSQTFEGTPDLSAWSMPQGSAAPWALTNAASNSGTGSLKSGTVGLSQTSSVKFRGVFAAGQLSFWARVDAGYCCNRMSVLVDGVQQVYASGSTQWIQHTLQIPAGIREIEWRFERDYYGGQASESAYLDDVVFTRN